MTNNSKMMTAAVIAFGLAFSPFLMAQAASDVPSANADNTQVNQRDRNASEMTADQQGNSKRDMDMTQQIRKALLADKDLSTDAHNLKIITRDGVVTLKGPVASEREHKAVLNTAVTIIGDAQFTDEISVKR